MIYHLLSFSYTVGRSIRNFSPGLGCITFCLYATICRVRRLAFTLHINQPPWQREDALREAAIKCYLPLIKLIKEKKHKVTLGVTLSLLELMDKYGYQQWLGDIKELVRVGKIELVGSAAYNAPLTKIPAKFAEKQIILNEYALGYYFGKKGGFEGDPSILIRDLKGFLPLNLVLNQSLTSLVGELGYEWVLVSSASLEPTEYMTKSGVYILKGKDVQDKDMRAVVVNMELSGLIENKADFQIAGFIDEIIKHDSCVIVVRGESFGLQNDQGILLFEHIMDSLKEKHVESLLVSEFVELENELGSIVIKENVEKNEDNETKEKYNVLSEIFDIYNPTESASGFAGAEDIALWKDADLQKIEDEELRKSVKTNLLFNKCLSAELLSEENVSVWEDFINVVQDDKLTESLKSKLNKLRPPQ